MTLCRITILRSGPAASRKAELTLLSPMIATSAPTNASNVPCSTTSACSFRRARASGCKDTSVHTLGVIVSKLHQERVDALKQGPCRASAMTRVICRPQAAADCTQPLTEGTADWEYIPKYLRRASEHPADAGPWYTCPPGPQGPSPLEAGMHFDSEQRGTRET